MPNKPQSPKHALYIGYTIGSLMRAGLPVKPIVDEDGDYTDTIRIDLDIPPAAIDGVNLKVTIELVVPPPADDWKMGDPLA